MLITFQCPGCQSKLEIESTAAGTELECPQCHTTVAVPRKGAGPGATIGGFRIKELLGTGAMGEVYLAQQLSMGRDVALKILPARLTADKDLVERFVQEVRLAARLEHPNLVAAHEAGEDGGVYFLAMTYVKGDPLDIVLERDGPLKEADALQVVLKLAAALAYAWKEHRLLHRDIKPSNIMLDPKGDPKLMDLGLSKSLSVSKPGLTLEDTIVGTPNYMSPEQAAGRADLDLRADMYSLGATLYHMLTGSMPFAGNSVLETLRKQATEPLPDPREFKPDISEPCIALLEIMLAKNPARRHESWEALTGDVERVLAGQPPTKARLAAGESTLLRGLRTPVERPKAKAPLALAVLAIGVLAVAVWYYSGGETAPASAPPAPAAPAAPPPAAEPVPQAPPPEPQARPDLPHMLREALDHGLMEPEDFAGRRERLERVLAAGAGTALEPRVGDALRKLASEERSAVASLMQDLRDKAERLSAEGKPEEAVSAVAGYEGVLSAETADARQALAAELQQRAAGAREEAARQAEAERAAATGARLNALHRDVAADLLKSDFDSARLKIAGAEADDALRDVAGEVTALRQLVASVEAMPRIVLDSFRRDEGKEAVVGFKAGNQALIVGRVDGRAVVARRQLSGAGYAERRFMVDDLSVQEKLARLGGEVAPHLDIMRGLLLYQMRKPEPAVKYFRRAGAGLGGELAALAEGQISESKSAETEKAYTALLRMAGVSPEETDSAKLASAIRRTAYRADEILRLRDGVAKFRQAYGATERAKAVEPVLAALDRADVTPREVDPAAVDAVVRNIEARNPGVTTLLFMFDVGESGMEMDLSKNAELSDISPLAGLPLARLSLGETKVGDLSALKNMPLEYLDVHGCPVSDLGVLEGMPLKELNVAGCRVANIGPLAGAPLEVLHLHLNPVSRLTPLSGLPLKHLNLWKCPVDDIRPLRGLPLEWLSLAQTKVTDIKILKGMPLNWLSLLALPITDLSPLEGMPLNTLHLTATPVADLSVVKVLPLTELMIDHCPNIPDLAPLAGKQLTALGMVKTRITDLSPLRGMPLAMINLTGSAFASLEPLKGIATLTHVGWDDWDQYRLMVGWTFAGQGDLRPVARRAAELAATMEGVPAFVPFVNRARLMADVMLPEWEALLANPKNLRARAKPFGGHAYLLWPVFTDLDDTLKFCAQHKAHLATINSKEENAWIAATFGLPGIPVRIGGSDEKKEGEWRWLTGEPLSYMNWSPGQPDNFRGGENSMVFFLSGRWHDVGGGMACAFLMEWEP